MFSSRKAQPGRNKQQKKTLECADARERSKGERKKEERIKNANTDLSPFVFAPQMKMQAFSLEAWCKL